MNIARSNTAVGNTSIFDGSVKLRGSYACELDIPGILRHTGISFQLLVGDMLEDLTSRLKRSATPSAADS